MDKSGNAAAFLNVTCVCNDSGGNGETTDDSADTLYDPDSQGEIIVDLTDILNEFMRENAKNFKISTIRIVMLRQFCFFIITSKTAGH